MNAVVLAGGRGTRMRRVEGVNALDPAQSKMADRGLKMLIPFHGRAFIEYLLDDLARAGIASACVVTGPHTTAVREHLERIASPVALRHATQPEPRGTADALRAAEPDVAGEPFLVLNADNLYAPSDLARLVGGDGCGLIGYSREGLLRGGIPEARLGAFALIDVDATGALRDIVEKPDAATAAALGAAPVSMTCWRFDARIFDACREITPSQRGELELPDAVRLLVGRGVRFDVLYSDAPVVDLSTRADVARVGALLRTRSG